MVHNDGSHCDGTSMRALAEAIVNYAEHGRQFHSAEGTMSDVVRNVLDVQMTNEQILDMIALILHERGYYSEVILAHNIYSAIDKAVIMPAPPTPGRGGTHD